MINNGPKEKQQTNTSTLVATQQATQTTMNTDESVKLLTALVTNKHYYLFFEAIKQLSFTEISAISVALYRTKNIQTLAMLRSDKGGLWSYYLTELHKMDTSVPLKPPADIQDHKKDCWHYYTVMKVSHAIYQRQNEEISYISTMHEGWFVTDTHIVKGENVTLERLKTRHNQLEALNKSLIRCKIDLNSNSLILCDARITRIPESLFHDKLLAAYWENLVKLDCRYNLLQQLPESLSNLVALEQLFCCSNKLMKLPNTIGNLNTLRTLDCSFNELHELPYTIGNLKLLHFNCSHNEIEQLPESLRHLKALQMMQTFICHSNRLHVFPKNIQDTFGNEWCDLTLARQHRPTFGPAMLPGYAAARAQAQVATSPDNSEEALTNNIANLKLN